MLINLVLLGILAYCSFTDLTWHKIYNYITLPGIVLGLGLNTALYGLPGLRSSGLGLATGFLILLVCFYTGGMGGGDIKLLAAIGALKGFPFILFAVFYTILCGGILKWFPW